MTLRYGYITTAGKECGFYQCETDDFRKFWKAANNEIRCLVLEMANGDVWLYYKGERPAGRWQEAKRKRQKENLVDMFS